jgi:hypothetical protein
VSVGVAFKKCPFFKGGFFKLLLIPKEEKNEEILVSIAVAGSCPGLQRIGYGSRCKV